MCKLKILSPQRKPHFKNNQPQLWSSSQWWTARPEALVLPSLSHSGSFRPTPPELPDPGPGSHQVILIWLKPEGHEDACLPLFSHGPWHQTHWKHGTPSHQRVRSKDLPLERQNLQIMWMKPSMTSRSMSSSKTMKLRMKLMEPCYV